MLQHTGGPTGGINTSIREILAAYLGEECWRALKEASVTARTDKTRRVERSVHGQLWPGNQSDAPFRGGESSSGKASAFRLRVAHNNSHPFSDRVDFVLAFGGSGTLPSMISSTVRSLLLEIGVFGEGDVWSALCRVLAASNDVLDYTTAVLVYAVKSGGQRVVECRQITKDIPGLRAFGYEFKSCGTAGCQPTPADLRVYNRDSKVHLRCLKCGWRSAPVRTDEDNKHFKRIDKTMCPTLFWHYYPASSNLQNFFVEQTAVQPKVAALAQTAKGKKGMDKKGKGKQRDLDADIKEDSEMARYDSDSALPMNIFD
ncbi:hypothetical protein BDR04DRAFT_1165032 [Suillus decipiens]|nr:hypothetical protein BDR04DRAFT_1165032 [Suillus decipiens]